MASSSSPSSSSSPPPPPKQQQQQPEIFHCKPTPHCPNSPLPVLLYRNVLPYTRPLTEDLVRAAIEPNRWKHGGTFKHFGRAHFHSNTHEAYAALAGSTQCLYGVGPLDDETDGVVFEMQAGDIAVHAAGVSHRNVSSSADYAYMGLYPEGAPKWNNNYCRADEEETRAKADEAREIPVPDWDPVYGVDGPLPQLWRKASSA